MGKRKALAIVVVGFSVLIEGDNAGKIKRAQVALGASSKIPLRLPAIESYLTGKALTEETF
jgi:carbon-monoxide dehydrogenase medium subunit/xanthine dehydrogenase FAD-binding subunit